MKKFVHFSKCRQLARLACAAALLAAGVCTAGAYSYIPLPQDRGNHGQVERMPPPGPRENRRIPPDAYFWGGHCYYIFENCRTWEQAERFCESLGGHLASISSPQENSALYYYMRCCGYQNAYFGYTDSLREGSWHWANGEPPRYENWAHGEPNSENALEDYAMFFYKFQDGTWNDGDFGGQTVNGGTAFICEWDSLYE